MLLEVVFENFKFCRQDRVEINFDKLYNPDYFKKTFRKVKCKCNPLKSLFFVDCDLPKYILKAIKRDKSLCNEITKDYGIITLTYRQDDFLIDYILKITESEIIQTTDLVYLDLYLKDENSDCAKTINENTKLKPSEKKALEKIKQFEKNTIEFNSYEYKDKLDFLTHIFKHFDNKTNCIMFLDDLLTKLSYMALYKFSVELYDDKYENIQKFCLIDGKYWHLLKDFRNCLISPDNVYFYDEKDLISISDYEDALKIFNKPIHRRMFIEYGSPYQEPDDKFITEY